MSDTAAAAPTETTAARLLGSVGRGFFRLLGHAGRLMIFIAATVTRPFHRRLGGRELVSQLSFVGAGSVGVVTLSAVFTGLVLVLQGYIALARFGSENLVGSLVALSLTRELAPVLAALMVTARAGSAMAATIGNMAVTEQIDALGALAVDPLRVLVLPRLLATAVALPLLAALFSVSGIAAGYLLGVNVLGLDGLAFMSNVRSSVEWQDVWVGLCKALVFGVLIASIATFRGCQTKGGALGVGRATSRTVVETAVLILCGDYVMTALLF